MFRLAVHFLVLGFALIGIEAAKKCAQRVLSTGIVCVCNSTYCDTVDPINQLPSNRYYTYVTNQEGLRLERNIGSFERSGEAEYTLTVKEDQVYQTVIGFGGSFTDAFGINYLSLSPATRQRILSSYFSNEGSEYSLCRVPIGGTDFSTHGYSYDDTEDDEPDPTLSKFSLQPEDFQYKIPLIKAAEQLANNSVKLITSAWTAPKWMKLTKNYAGMFGFIKSEYYQTWADYKLKFLKAYKNESIEFWGLTTGNEPSLAFFPGNQIPTNGWLPNGMKEWIKNNLGPTIRNSEFSDIKLIGIDDQVFLYPLLSAYLNRDDEVSEYLDGFGLHWYWNFFLGRKGLTWTQDAIPDKFIISTEACTGSYLVTPSVILGSWFRGMWYAIDIIRDLNLNVAGWIDWNMALNTTGGPTYISNEVDSPIIVNADDDEFYKNPMYYALTHFSKFIPSGSVRIQIEDSGSDLYSVAFKRPDQGITIVLLNRHNKDVDITINSTYRRKINLTVGPNSFTTILYW